MAGQGYRNVPRRLVRPQDHGVGVSLSASGLVHGRWPSGLMTTPEAVSSSSTVTATSGTLTPS